MNVIAHNVLAMNAQRQFQITGTKAKKNVEKLSSGYRINRAADDAAGLFMYAAMDSLGVTDDVDAIYAELSWQKV